MYISSKIGIIADDLTGANDTALQFFMKGAVTKILLDFSDIKGLDDDAQVWALPTESRNIPPEVAVAKVKEAIEILKQLGVEYFYKKMDSTLRGNVAQETLAFIEELDYKAAIILPAFPPEGRTTVGGYHLLRSTPIQRTEFALDPHHPIYESHIPTMLKRQLPEEGADLVGSIGLDVVMKGAAPILFALNDQIAQGKKLIVVDSVSVVDIEQVALALNKCSHKILPCGSAGLAQALTNIWIDDVDEKNEEYHKKLPKRPRLVISGSATELVGYQIKKLCESNEIENVHNLALTADDIFNGNIESIVNRALPLLEEDNTVIIHSSDINVKDKSFAQFLFEKEISLKDFISKIVNYLSLIMQELVAQKEVDLILIGGETSYVCANTIHSHHLQVVDAITQAVPLCVNSKGQYLVTKSGNLGTLSTLIDILKYFKNHE